MFCNQTRVLVASGTISHGVTYMELESRRRRERDWGKKLFEKIMANIFKNLVGKKITLGYITTGLKIKDNLKVSQRGETRCLQGHSDVLMTDVSSGKTRQRPKINRMTI